MALQTKRDGDPDAEVRSELAQHHPLVLLAIEIVRLMKQIVSGLLGTPTVVTGLLVLGAVTIAMMVKVPPANYAGFTRAFGSVAASVGSVLKDAFFSILGYLLAAAIAVVSLIVITTQHRRILSQGNDLRSFRAVRDPSRPSSHMSPEDLLARTRGEDDADQSR